MKKTLNPASLFVATLLGAVFLFWAGVASAYQNIVFDNGLEKFPNFDDSLTENNGVIGFVDTIATFPYTSGWNWRTFIYSSSSTSVIDNITFGSTFFPQTRPASARWEVYRTNSTSSVGNLIGFTDYKELSYFVGGLTQTYTWDFNTPITIGGGYYYRFVFQLEPGKQASFHYTYASSSNVYVQNCFNEYAIFGEPIDDCEDNFENDTYNGDIAVPFVTLAYGGNIQNGEYVTTDAPCQTNSNTIPASSCNAPVPLTEVSVSGFANFETSNKKVSIFLRDKFLNTLDSVAFYYTTAGYYDFENTFYDLQASTTYNILTCISDAQAVPTYATNPTCTTIIYTNGDNPVSYEQYWCELFPTDPGCQNATSTPTLWANLSCDEIGITDVKKGVQCALVWAFEPSQNSIAQFQRAKDAILFSVPLGYATYMVQDVIQAFTSTSTSVFTRDIEIGKYFGKPNTATTTLSLATTTQHIGMFNPVFDLLETIVWIMFAVWFIYWALTRQL